MGRCDLAQQAATSRERDGQVASAPLSTEGREVPNILFGYSLVNVPGVYEAGTQKVNKHRYSFHWLTCWGFCIQITAKSVITGREKERFQKDRIHFTDTFQNDR